MSRCGRQSPPPFLPKKTRRFRVGECENLRRNEVIAHDHVRFAQESPRPEREQRGIAGTGADEIGGAVHGGRGASDGRARSRARAVSFSIDWVTDSRSVCSSSVGAVGAS